jgi:hypothetical protein
MRDKIKNLLIALSILTVISGCEKSERNSTICTAEFKLAFASFNVVDPGTGRDLFFSNDPRYPLSQISFVRKRNKLYTDTVKPEVIGTGTERYFKIRIDNTIPADTMLLIIPVSPVNLPHLVFSYTVKKTRDVCPQYVLDKAVLNGQKVQEVNGKLILKTI